MPRKMMDTETGQHRQISSLLLVFKNLNVMCRDSWKWANIQRRPTTEEWLCYSSSLGGSPPSSPWLMATRKLLFNSKITSIWITERGEEDWQLVANVQKAPQIDFKENSKSNVYVWPHLSLRSGARGTVCSGILWTLGFSVEVSGH